MAETVLRVGQPTITFNVDALDDPRSFSFSRSVADISVGGRPGDAFNTTVQKRREGTSFSFTIGDETEARALIAPSDDVALVCVSTAVHGSAALTYTAAKSTITGYPPMGSGVGEARTFTFTGQCRSTDGSTDPLALS